MVVFVQASFLTEKEGGVLTRYFFSKLQHLLYLKIPHAAVISSSFIPIKFVNLKFSFF